MPIKSNIKTTETDCVIPSIGKLFASPNAAVRVTFEAVNSLKENEAGTRVISNNGVDAFKAKHGFDNDHLETSMARTMGQRPRCVKFGCCDENPRAIWRKHQKGDASDSVPRILGRTRMALKFMSATMKNT